MRIASGRTAKPFAEAEPGGELEVGAGRAHRDDQRLGRAARPLQPQLERLLGDDHVLAPGRPVAVQHLDLEPGRGPFAHTSNGKPSPVAPYGEPVEEGPGVAGAGGARSSGVQPGGGGASTFLSMYAASDGDADSRGDPPVRRLSAGSCDRGRVSMPWCWASGSRPTQSNQGGPRVSQFQSTVQQVPRCRSAGCPGADRRARRSRRRGRRAPELDQVRSSGRTLGSQGWKPGRQRRAC